MASLLTAKNVGSAFLKGSTQKLTQKRTNQKQSRKTNTSSVVRAEVKEIFMPALSSTMTEGKIVSWVKEEGDAISKGEAVVVVESDKADMDVESFYDGFLAHICVEDGEMATVGAPIAYVAETEAEIPEALQGGGGVWRRCAGAGRCAGGSGACSRPCSGSGGTGSCGTGAGCGGTSTGTSCEHWTNRCHAIREEAREEVEN